MSNLTIRANPSGTGTFIVESPNSNSNQTITLPDATTTLVGTDTTQTLTNKTLNGGALTLMTAQTPTSGTNVDFTGIPSWAKRVTVMLFGVSTTGAQQMQIQVGTSGGVQTSGYETRAIYIQSTSPGSFTLATGFPMTITGTAANLRSGTLTLAKVSGNNWVGTGTIQVVGNLVDQITGTVTLSGDLDRVRISAGTTDTFDAGTINILYEG